MKKNEKSTNTGAVLGASVKSTAYFLSLLFCALRACGVIQWKWYWLMSPVFISLGIGIAALVVAGIIACVALKND